MADKVAVVRIFKAFGGRTSDKQWSNTYHISGELEYADPAWDALVVQLASTESNIHFSNVNYMRATISSFDQEAEYNPEMLKVIELGGSGQRVLTGDQTILPLDFAFKWKKNVAFGRSGTTFYRGALSTDDIATGAGGDPVLKGTISPDILNAIRNMPTSLQPLLSAVGGFMVMAPKMPAPGGPPVTLSTRVLLSFAPSGVSNNRRNHRYFDKAASDDGVGVGT